MWGLWREGRVRSLAVPGWFGGVESLSGAGPAGWLRKAAAGFRIPRPSAGWFAGCVLLAAGAGDDGEDDCGGDEGGAGEAPCHGARAGAGAFRVTEP